MLLDVVAHPVICWCLITGFVEDVGVTIVAM